MPRRKRSSGLNERRRKVRRRGEENEEDEEDDTLLISDSEHDEEEEDLCPVKANSRAARRQEREKKTHMQDMTEDEMLDLALRLSKQEATSASQREQVEDDDMRKAIEESLQVSSIQASEPCSKRTRSAAKPHQDRGPVTARVRCKLSFSNKLEKDSGSDEDVSEAQTSLPPMPDLSQKTSLQPSSPSPTLPSVPSAASQESRSSHLAKPEVTAHSPDSSQSDSALKTSPVVLRDCSVRLNPDLAITGGSSKNLPRTNDSSENSPPVPESPVFPKTDSKRCTKLSRDTSRTSHSSFIGDVCKPEDASQGSSSHERGDSSKSSSRVYVPEEVVKVKDESCLEKGAVSTVPDTKYLDKFTSHMVLHLSDDDDDDDEEENDKIIPPSPVFPQDRSSRAGRTKLSPTQLATACSPPPKNSSPFQNKSSSQTSERTDVSRKSAEASSVTGKDEGIVSYYWGVPFCPKGQSPDDYTRVILTQLEVYEKSLKEAQRQLLHKVDWGLPVFPCSIERPHGRRLKRHRAPPLLEEEEEEDERDEKRDEGEQAKAKKAERKEMEESRRRPEEDAESEQRETYVVVSSPETQEELGKSPSKSNSAKPSSSCRRPVSQEHPEDTPIQPDPDENGEEVQNGGFDAVCPETQMSEDNTPELMVTSPAQAAESDVMEVDESTEPPAEPEERMDQERPGEEQSWRESVPSQVECPMCSRFFPLCKIEMHAAYCNGSVEEQDHEHTQDQQEILSQGSERPKSVRRTPLDDDVRFEKSEQREKCFICEKFFVRKEYTQHVDQCIKQKNLGLKQGNGLLSALHRTETVHLDDSGAGPSNTAGKKGSHSDASVMPTGSQTAPYSVSSSPFKSFTPISEIKDCLIDFRQRIGSADRTSQRLGRKRKFKR